MFKNVKVLIGSNALKQAKLGGVKKIIYSKNCPVSILNSIKRLEKLGLETEQFKGDSEALGLALGKPFPVAVVGVRR